MCGSLFCCMNVKFLFLLKKRGAIDIIGYTCRHINFKITNA